MSLAILHHWRDSLGPVARYSMYIAFVQTTSFRRLLSQNADELTVGSRVHQEPCPSYASGNSPSHMWDMAGWVALWPCTVAIESGQIFRYSYIRFICQDYASGYAAEYRTVREWTNENKASDLKKLSAGTIREHCESKLFSHLEHWAENGLGEWESKFALSYWF